MYKPNAAIFLYTGRINRINLSDNTTITSINCFILEHGRRILISPQILSNNIFKTISEKHPKTIIEEMFGSIEEAMDIFVEAKRQGGFWYNSNFIPL